MSNMANAIVSRPARTSYARTPPPATSQQQVWRSPSASTLSFPPIEVPPSVTAGLIDNPDSVAAGMNASPMVMPPAPEMPAPTDDDVAPPPDYDVMVSNPAQYAARVPEYLAPLPYIPLQPSRRYEVI
jgi:hypothetical protein